MPALTLFAVIGPGSLGVKPISPLFGREISARKLRIVFRGPRSLTEVDAMLRSLVLLSQHGNTCIRLAHREDIDVDIKCVARSCVASLRVESSMIICKN
jgi:hypothetical protein